MLLLSNTTVFVHARTQILMVRQFEAEFFMSRELVIDVKLLSINCCVF